MKVIGSFALIFLVSHVDFSFGQSLPNPAWTTININNLTTWVDNVGGHPNHVNQSWNGTFPKGTAGFIFSEGIFWGGLVNEGQGQSLRVNGHYYDIGGLYGGRILTDASGNVTGREPVDPATVRPYRVRPDWRTADLRDDAANFFLMDLADVASSHTDEIRAQYETDWNQWPWQKGAPFDDKNGNGTYEPTIDIPGIPGASQTLWIVYNDIDSIKVFQSFDCSPIGMEVQETYWAYATTTPLSNVLFKRARLIYKGTTSTPASSTIDSMYITQWADPDNGLYSDDFAGCDTILSIGYSYNSTSTDPIYFKEFGLPPPAGGYDFLQGAIVPGAPTDSAVFDLQWRKGFKNLPMTVFTFFSAGSPRSDPQARFGPRAPQWYNLMAGFEPQPRYPSRVPFYDHLGQITKFEVSGDPVAQFGDLDGKRTAANQRRFTAGDRRIVLSTGPFTMTRGDTQEVVIALVAGLGKDYLSSISVMKYNDQFAQFAYDNLFQIPSPPSQPKVTIAELDRRIVLEWGSDLVNTSLIEDTVKSGFAFEGYNIYQLASPTSRLQDAIRIATYDVSNLTSIILDKILDENTAFVVEKPVQFGTNSGVQRYVTITQDKVRNQPLVNGQTYYFTVTAYSYNLNLPPEAPFRVLESAPIILTATPQTPKPGIRYTNRFMDTLKTVHVAGLSDVTSLPITVISPTELKNASYRISLGKDSLGTLQWTLRNESVGQDILTSRVFGSVDTGDPNDDSGFPIVGGLRVAVTQIPPQLIDDSTKFLQPVPQIWLTGGGRFILGVPAVPEADAFVTTGKDLGPEGHGYLAQVASSFDPRFQVPVLLRFGPNRGQKAYRLRRTGTGTAFLIQATNPTPTINIEAYDVTDPANPRQLTLSWRDQINNGIFDPPVGGDGLEILFIHFRTYDSTMSQYAHSGLGQTATDNEVTVGTKADIMYGVSCGLVSGHALNESDIDMRIRSAIRLGPGDQYTFSTTAPSFSQEIIKADVLTINVFPNPYFGFNTRELSRLDKYVTFNHLPSRATIRIFNLGGVLLRVIEKDDPSQFAKWDLRNRENLPVASGIYVVHIEMPDLGTAKILKLAVVQEEQILNVY